MMQKAYVQPGERVLIECAHSEVCMHMRVAGKRMLAEVLAVNEPLAQKPRAAQLYTLDGQPFSFPILLGEAGFFEDSHGIYYYPVSAFHA